MFPETFIKLASNGTFGMLFVNNFLIVGYTCSRVAIFVSGTRSEWLPTGTSF